MATYTFEYTVDRLVNDAKRLEFAAVRLPVNRNVGDLGGFGANFAELYDCPDGVFFALKDSLYTAVLEVFDPTGNTSGLCLAFGVLAEEYSLDFAGYVDVCSDFYHNLFWILYPILIHTFWLDVFSNRIEE